MKHVTVTRLWDTGFATFGRLEVRDHDWTLLFRCYTVERPWDQNRVGISCIPEGDYRAKLGNFKGQYQNYELQAVPGRAYIEFHKANWASQLEGCIAPGLSIGMVEGRIGVTSSSAAFDGVMKACAHEPEVLFHVIYLDPEVRP